VLTTAGFEKPSYHLRRSWWSDEPTAYLVARTWNHELGQKVEVICYANADELTLPCGDDEFPLTFDETAGWWCAVMPYRAVPLTVVGRKGEVVVRDALGPRGEAARLEAEVWTIPPDVAALCTAAGLTTDDVVQIEIALRDEHGNLVTDERPVSVKVSDGDLLGLDNGDLGDPTPYPSPSRRTKDARAIAYVRATRATVVTLSAPGLADVQLDQI
jgi:hypothetical protein